MVNLPHCGIHQINRERRSQLHPGNKQIESLEHKQFQDEELLRTILFLFLSLFLSGILQTGTFQGRSRMRKSWGQDENVSGVRLLCREECIMYALSKVLGTQEGLSKCIRLNE